MASDEQGDSDGFKVQEGTIFVSGMGPSCNEQSITEFFSSIGVIKTDKKTGKPKVWLYKNKTTGENKGEATVTYDDPPTAEAAIKWFDGKDFHGNQIKVELAKIRTGFRSRDSTDRNPSPPTAEVIEDDDEIEILHADLIEGTAFSKKWTLAALLKLGKEVEKEKEKKDEKDAAEANAHGIDISEDLENDLCRLWDMSTNMQVCKYLEEWKTVDILMDVIIKSNAPRVVEIAMGILGNMACCPPIAMNFSENKQLRDLILATLGSSDARTLIETTRLISTCLGMHSSQELWLSAISSGEQEVFEKLCFILKSSTNGDLLHATTNLVDTILDIDEEILNDWANTTLIEAIVESNKQVQKERRETVGMLLHILNILSTTDTGVETLVESTSIILPLLVDYIGRVCEQEEFLSVRGQENSIASAVSVLDVLTNTSPPNLDAVLKHNPKTLPRLLCILAAAKDTSPGPPKSKTLPAGNNKPKVPENAKDSSSSSSNVAIPLQSEKKTEAPKNTGDESSQDASEVSQDASITEVTQDDSVMEVSKNTQEEEEDSDIEEIECVAIVTKESHFLTDVLMELFCNLLENHDAGTSELLSCLKSCNKEHVDGLKKSLSDTNPELLAILDDKPTG